MASADPSYPKDNSYRDRRDLTSRRRRPFFPTLLMMSLTSTKTDNTHDLVKVAWNDKRVIVTHSENHYHDACLGRQIPKGLGKIKDLRVAFVVDECHRAVTPQTQKDISAFSTLRSGMAYRHTNFSRQTKAIRRFKHKPPTNNMANACRVYGQKKPSMTENKIQGDYWNTIISADFLKRFS